VGEAIKSGGFPQVGKPDEMAKFKFIDKYNKLKTIHCITEMVSLDHYHTVQRKRFRPLKKRRMD